MSDPYFNLHYCEVCDNILLMRKKEKIFPCPLCGCLNESDELDDRKVILRIVSPKMMCEQDPDNEDTVVLKDLNPELDGAIRVLVENGWTLKFIDDKDEK